jgi:hypothetical protein
MPEIIDERLLNTVRTDSGDISISHLLSTEQVSRLLNVHQRTVHAWIEKDTIPYVELPHPDECQRRQPRIPAAGLLQVLGGSYDATELFANFCEQEFNQ